MPCKANPPYKPSSGGPYESSCMEPGGLLSCSSRLPGCQLIACLGMALRGCLQLVAALNWPAIGEAPASLSPLHPFD